MANESGTRFEIVHTGPFQFHARFVASNGETVWVTESYRQRKTAREAVSVLTTALGAFLMAPPVEVEELAE